MIPEITENYARYRIRNPELFIENSFRTLDIGKPGYHKLIRGKLKSNGKWKTQSIIVEKDVVNVPLVKKMTFSLIKKAKRE